MRLSRIGLALFAAAFVLLVYGGSKPQAFHDGGVAECGGCHSMHDAKSTGGKLLIATDPSSTCLTCHGTYSATASSYHISTPDSNMGAGVAPTQRTPGGDFGWLKKTYVYAPRTGAANVTDSGDTHGHNIIAIDNGYAVDPTNTFAPGGQVFASSNLGCPSCHDPHGRARRLSDGTYVNAIYNPGSSNAPIIGSGSYTPSASNPNSPAAGQAVGVYRLLRGLGDNSQGVTFNGVAVAIAPSTYNQGEGTNQVRVAYGGGNSTNAWGAWCGTCHPTMHAGGALVHKVDESLTQSVVDNYNAYRKSGDLTGTNADAFLSLVPFVEATSDVAVLKTHASNAGAFKLGPTTSDQVSCVSCHRAHASGFPEMLRFGMEYEMMVYNGTYTGIAGSAQGRTEAEMQAAYYDRPATQWASYQRVLCNKCHAKD